MFWEEPKKSRKSGANRNFRSGKNGITIELTLCNFSSFMFWHLAKVCHPKCTAASTQIHTHHTHAYISLRISDRSIIFFLFKNRKKAMQNGGGLTKKNYEKDSLIFR